MSQIGTKLRDWAVGRAVAGCYPQAVLSSNDSKTRYLCNTGMPRQYGQTPDACESHLCMYVNDHRTGAFPSASKSVSCAYWIGVKARGNATSLALRLIKTWPPGGGGGR